MIKVEEKTKPPFLLNALQYACSGALLVFVLCSRAYVMAAYWCWFVVPLAPDVFPVLRVPQAFGLALTLSAFSRPLPSLPYSIGKDVPPERHGKSSILFICAPWISYFIGKAIFVYGVQ